LNLNSEGAVMNQHFYVQKLEKSIDNYLNNITELQDRLRQEEDALQNCLRELRVYEINLEIANYKTYAAG
jgi:hypothetical protein